MGSAVLKAFRGGQGAGEEQVVGGYQADNDELTRS